MRTPVLLTLAAALASPPALADDAVQSLLAAGMEAQKEGRVEAAVDRYSSCLSKDPEFVPCHWELGWAYWTRNDWAGVVEQWRTVKRLQPDHPEVDQWLPQAEENLANERKMTELLREKFGDPAQIVAEYAAPRPTNAP